MPKTGESGKERRERTEAKGSYRGASAGGRNRMGMWGGDTSRDSTREENKRYLEDHIENAAKTGEQAFPWGDMSSKLAKRHNEEHNPNTRGYAKGGSVSSRADGVAVKGKTKGRFV